MRPHRCLSLLFAIGLVCAPTLGRGQGARLHAKSGQNEEDHPRERAEWFLRGRKVPGRPAARLLQRAWEQKLKTRADRAARVRTSGAQLQNSQISGAATAAAAQAAFGNTSAMWTPVGPGPTATASGSTSQDYGPAIGRITAVAVDPTDATGNTVYVGGAYGGVWRSRNAADPATSQCPNSVGTCAPNVQWQPIMDDQPTLAVGAIAIHPTNGNWILVGTGEANNAIDSYYGLGFLLSKDGGQSWTLIDTADNGTHPLHGLGITRIAFSTANPNVVVATAAAASAGIDVGAETGGVDARGIYYSLDAGQSWQRARLQDPSGLPPAAGSANSVIYNAAAGKFLANLRFHGFYSSTDGINWTRLPSQPGGGLLSITACPTSPTSQNCPLYRAEMTVVPGRNEMYAFIVDVNGNNQGIFQSLDGGASWSTLPNAVSSMDNCGDDFPANACGTAQGVYNLTLAAIPNGSATDLYAGAVNQFKCTLAPPSNLAGCNFANITHVYGCPVLGSFSHVHPDQHAIDFSLANPRIIYFGNDGGVFRTLDSFATNTGVCSNPPGTPWFHNLNATFAGSMLQFISMSQHPADETVVLGGTQDNGSPATSGASAGSGTWLSVNNGDGGFNNINPNSTDEWFTAPPVLRAGSPRVNIERCTLGINCTSSAIASRIDDTNTAGDASGFYFPYLLDPNAPHRLIVGTCRVWRGNSDGTGTDWGTSGTPLSINFHVDTAGTASSTGCTSAHLKVNALAAAGQATAKGSQVVYAGTEGDVDNAAGGELWVTTSADGGPSTWKKALAFNTSCGAAQFNPKHYSISDIATDPSDSSGHTAYVTVMGFTSGLSGHVFKVTVGDSTSPSFSATCVDVSGNLPDAPADSVVADPTTSGTLYVGTDVGVFVTSSAVSGALWNEVGPLNGSGALPNVVVTRLRRFQGPNGSVRLRASTYGRGVWETVLSPDFALAVANAAPVYPPQTAGFQVTVTPLNGYNKAVTVSCDDPSLTCPAIQFDTGLGAQTKTLNVSKNSVGDVTFNVKATDGTLTHTRPAILRVVDFGVEAVSPATISAPHTSPSAPATFNVRPLGSFDNVVTLSCQLATGQPLPAGMACSFGTGNTVQVRSPSAAAVQLVVSADDPLPHGSYNLVIAGTSPGAPAPRLSPAFTVNVPSHSTIALQARAVAAQKASSTFHVPLTVESHDGYSGTATLRCTPPCSLSQSSVSVPLNGSAPPVDVSIATTADTVGNLQVTVDAEDAADPTIRNSAIITYTVTNYAVDAPAINAVPGGPATLNITLTPLNGYAGSLAIGCIVPSAFAGSGCTLNPAGPVVLGATQTITATMSVPANTAAGAYAASIQTSDTQVPALLHNINAMVNVGDYKLEASPATATIRAGGTTSHTITATALGSFAGTVTFACSGLPQLASCSFAQNSVQVAAGGAATTSVTIATTSSTARLIMPGGRRRALFAFWLGLPGIGLALITTRVRRRVWLGMLAAMLLASLTACGGGGGTTATPIVPRPGTPAGTYTITVTASSGSGATTLQRSAQITLTVQ